MKYKLIIIFITFLSNGCVKKENVAELYPNQIIIDSSRIAIIKYESGDLDCRQIFKDAKSAVLNNKDLIKIELAINKIIEKQNPLEIERFKELSKAYPEENYRKEDFVLRKDDYLRRYLVVTNSKGEKEIFVAMVCDAIAKDFNFRNTLKQGHGGGSCLFSFKLNLSTNRNYEVKFNAEA
ncbi:MAG: hypothetical protein EOO50_15755 [Flavobacterium sp.]|uniref:hypothetical protein n=1 Tax=Flavobacterium sp. TaxID=239 RepID=UPI0012206A00|nr:hypothetical protein [Flavobacterium sp.]RZJ64410.1 MAG: hypothetical protein EOO50_15755 [Flavobacterium sp.]